MAGLLRSSPLARLVEESMCLGLRSGLGWLTYLAGQSSAALNEWRGSEPALMDARECGRGGCAEMWEDSEDAYQWRFWLLRRRNGTGSILE